MNADYVVLSCPLSALDPPRLVLGPFERVTFAEDYVWCDGVPLVWTSPLGHRVTYMSQMGEDGRVRGDLFGFTSAEVAR